MNEKEKPSLIISEFLSFLETATSKYESAYCGVGEEDKRVQDFLHGIEFSKDRSERNKIATQFQISRKRRRMQKDQVQLYESVYKFYTDRQNQHIMKALRRLLNDQNAIEKYLFGERKYTKRVEENYE